MCVETVGLNSQSRSDSAENITSDLKRHNASDCPIESKRQREQQLLRTCAGLRLTNEHTEALDLLCNVAVRSRLRNHRCLETDPAGSRRCRWWSAWAGHVAVHGTFWSRHCSVVHLSECLVAVLTDVWVREQDVLPEVATSHSRFHMCEEVIANLNCSWRRVLSRDVHQNSPPAARIKPNVNSS